MQEFPYVQTSVFVDDRYMFSGNQLATLWDPTINQQLSSEEMQGIAREFNFSETTFVLKPTLDDYAAKVRIFTPGSEIPFAGHPTLGTAFVLKHTKLIDADIRTALIELGIGPIEVKYIEKDIIQMKQNPPEYMDFIDNEEAILTSIGLSPDDASQDYPAQFVSTGNYFLILPLRSLQAVQKAVPNPELVRDSLQDQPSQLIMIFSTETLHKGTHVHARMFAPTLGVLEDPATGSAAGPLTAFLESHYVLENHKHGRDIYIEQGHEIQRPSLLIGRAAEDMESDGVFVSGKVRLIAEGKFYL